MKKKTVLLLVLMLIFSMCLAGCGSDDSNADMNDVPGTYDTNNGNGGLTGDLGEDMGRMGQDMKDGAEDILDPKDNGMDMRNDIGTDTNRDHMDNKN